MTRTLHGKVHGRMIELDEDLGVPEGQQVEVDVRVITDGRKKPDLDDVYAILAERFDTGESDVAERHNEHPS